MILSVTESEISSYTDIGATYHGPIYLLKQRVAPIAEIYAWNEGPHDEHYNAHIIELVTDPIDQRAMI